MTTNKELKIRIKTFESEIKLAQKKGHVSSINHLDGRKGVEIVLPTTVSADQAVLIATYIRKKHNFEACFFIKKHNINVYYDV